MFTLKFYAGHTMQLEQATSIRSVRVHETQVDEVSFESANGNQKVFYLKALDEPRPLILHESIAFYDALFVTNDAGKTIDSIRK